MADLTYLVATSLDGRIADHDGDPSALSSGPHLQALADAWPDTFPTHVRAAFGIADVPPRRFDTVIMGRRTYEPALAAGITAPYAHLDQHVVSTTLDAHHDPAVTVVRDDPAAHVRALKAGDRLGVWLCGGGRLAAALLDEIDELVLKVNPVVLGSGTPLVAGRSVPRTFDLVGTATLPGGVVVQHLRR